jgi:dihydrofolate reductase
MAPLIYSLTCSLDGYIEDPSGSFDWSAPDEEVHSFINERLRGVGTYLFGRRMYETMRVWDEPAAFAGDSAAVWAFAEIWQASDKVVYSKTLPAVSTAHTRLEREFDPDGIRRLKQEADRPLEVGGPGLAAAAFRAGLVDEVYLYVIPVALGGGKPALPEGIRLDLDLREVQRFGNGTVFLGYAVGPGPVR